MRKTLAIITVMALLASPMLILAADVSGEIRIATGGADKINPVIRGDFVAWSEIVENQATLFVKKLSTSDVWNIATGPSNMAYFQGKEFLDESGYVCWRDKDTIFGMQLIKDAIPVALTNGSDWLPEGVTGTPYITEVCMDGRFVFFCAATDKPFAGYFGVDVTNPKPFLIKSFANTKSTHKMSAEGGYLAFDAKDGQNGDIFLFDVSKRSLVSVDNSSTDQAYPVVQKNHVFYMSSKDTDKTVFDCMAKDMVLMCYNIETKQKFVLYDSPEGSYFPLLNPTSNYLILRRSSKYNTSYIAIDPQTKSVTNITEFGYNTSFVFSGSASGDWVAINYYRVAPIIGESGVTPGEDLNIRAFNVKTKVVVQVCQNSKTQMYPMMFGKTVIWADYRNSDNNSDIFACNLDLDK